MLKQGTRVMVIVIHGSRDKKYALNHTGIISQYSPWHGSGPESYPYKIQFDEENTDNELRRIGVRFSWDRDELLELK